MLARTPAIEIFLRRECGELEWEIEIGGDMYVKVAKLRKILALPPFVLRQQKQMLVSNKMVLKLGMYVLLWTLSLRN
jgi:hypothetical protein